MKFHKLITWENPLDSALFIISLNITFLAIGFSSHGFFYTLISLMLYFIAFGFVYLKVNKYLTKDSKEESDEHEFDQRRIKQE